MKQAAKIRAGFCLNPSVLRPDLQRKSFLWSLDRGFFKKNNPLKAPKIKAFEKKVNFFSEFCPFLALLESFLQY